MLNQDAVQPSFAQPQDGKIERMTLSTQGLDQYLGREGEWK